MYVLSYIQCPWVICQEECAHVQSKCQETWQTAEAALFPFLFINCDNTSQLLFPLPHCCTGAGILTGTKELASSTGNCSYTVLIDLGLAELRNVRCPAKLRRLAESGNL